MKTPKSVSPAWVRSVAGMPQVPASKSSPKSPASVSGNATATRGQRL